MRDAPIALTSGDPAGVGPELTVAAWAALKDELTFAILADPSHLSKPANDSGVPLIEIQTIDQALDAMVKFK